MPVKRLLSCPPSASAPQDSTRRMAMPVRSSYSLRKALASASVKAEEEEDVALLEDDERRAREDCTSVRSSRDSRLAAEWREMKIVVSVNTLVLHQSCSDSPLSFASFASRLSCRFSALSLSNSSSLARSCFSSSSSSSLVAPFAIFNFLSTDSKRCFNVEMRSC
jgi:hypothetical protein